MSADLKTVWAAPSTDARLKKRIIRTVIHEVIADIDPEAAEIVLVVHWIGGVHSEMRLPRRRRGQRNSTSADVIAAVRQLALIANDDLIAGILNRNGLVAGNGNRWTRERVTSLRSHHRISVYKPADDGIEPWLNLSNAARLLHISPRTLRLAAQAGEIDAIHPLPDGPWIFSRAALSDCPLFAPGRLQRACLVQFLRLSNDVFSKFVNTHVLKLTWPADFFALHNQAGNRRLAHRRRA